MKLRHLFSLLTLSMIAGAAGAATDVSGTWSMSVETPMGSGSPTFVLKQSGEKVEGTYRGALGEAPVTGSVKGSTLVLSYSISGNPVTYTGTLAGNKVSGTADLGQVGKGKFSGTKQ